MNTIIEWLSNISVEQIVSYISSVGMVITAIVSIVISIKAKIKTNENIDCVLYIHSIYNADIHSISAYWEIWNFKTRNEKIIFIL